VVHHHDYIKKKFREINFTKNLPLFSFLPTSLFFLGYGDVIINLQKKYDMKKYKKTHQQHTITYTGKNIF
jgi:hypothetical protein